MDPLEQLIRQVDSLPTLPAVPVRVLELLDDAETTLDQIGETIGLDPVLASRVMRLANSSYFGGGARASTLEAAVMRLGTGEVRSAVLTIAVIDALPQESLLLDLREFWRHALASAVISRRLARDVRSFDPERAYLAGLVHGLGEIILALYFPDRFERAILDARSAQRAARESLQEEFKFLPPELAARVLERWSFPEEIVEAVEHQLSPGGAPAQRALAAILLAANRICGELGIGITYPGDPERDWIAEIPADVVAGLPPEQRLDLPAYLRTLGAEVEAVAEMIGAIFSQSAPARTTLLS